MSDETQGQGATPTAQELKAAFKAFKRRLRLERLDAESKISGNPLSSGRRSEIVAIAPPRVMTMESPSSNGMAVSTVITVAGNVSGQLVIIRNMSMLART